MSDAYAASGVDTDKTDSALSGLVAVLSSINTGGPSRSVLGSGHYANVLRVAPNLGIAVGTDGVGSKVIVAEETGRFDTVGIDCVAMNVNDLICVGAEPIALVDYIAVEAADPEMLRQIAVGLKVGAEAAGVEIPGGELAILPELIRGHPSPSGFDLCGAAFGTVALDAIITGSDCAAGDCVLGMPSSGLHSNGYTLARRALQADGGLALTDRPAALSGASVADVLLEPTVIYVRAVLELLRSDVDAPLDVAPVFDLIRELGGVSESELWEVFNMGCGFVVIVGAQDEAQATAILAANHPGTRRIGTVTADSDRITLPTLGIAGGPDGLAAA
ncbi:MAG: phosphoribosylformylglycinamidine cyclo-ligase [Solirubrobacterales bacterium]|nr:phosphoribosylformylglycinamidine cyclo-ligase [Solirubrobacterales bacterium]